MVQGAGWYDRVSDGVDLLKAQLPKRFGCERVERLPECGHGRIFDHFLLFDGPNLVGQITVDWERDEESGLLVKVSMYKPEKPSLPSDLKEIKRIIVEMLQQEGLLSPKGEAVPA